MLTKEDLQAIGEIVEKVVDKKLKPIKADMKKIKENTEITRDVTNNLVEWVDFYYSKEKPFPMEDKAI